MTSYSKSVTEKLKNLQENLSSKLGTFVHGYTTKSMRGNNMSLGSTGHAVAIGSGLAAQNAYSSTLGNITTSTGTTSTWLGQPIMNEGQHIFNCQKVENGWTLNYRNKQYIAADLDSLMDQIKAAMVMERIEK